MIVNSAQSLTKLGDFFQKSPNLTELDIPEMIHLDGNSEYSTPLSLLDTNIKSIKFKNLEQAPFYIGGNKLQNIELNKLKYIEFGRYILNNVLTNYYISFLQNTKIQNLNLPSFLGTTNPIPGNGDIYGMEIPILCASFRDNYWLRDVAFGQDVSSIRTISRDECFNGYWFANNYNLKFLRLYYPYVLPLNRQPLGLQTTPIGTGKGNGYIYVPDELVDAYKEEQNWNILVSKIRPMSMYAQAKSEDNDSIIKSWAEIIADCNNNLLDPTIYQVGATKTLFINGVPTQMVIVQVGNNGMNAAQSIYNRTADGASPSLIWLEKTINRFNTVPLSGLNSSNIARQYKNVTSLQQHLNTLYENIDDEALRANDGIKTMRKYGYGDNETGTDENYYYCDVKLWVPSTSELGSGIHNSNQRMPIYSYFKNDYIKPDYKLGETNNRTGVSIVTRDFSGNANSYLDSMQYNEEEGYMTPISNSATNPYVIFGFAT